jgi:hypothetical protein
VNAPHCSVTNVQLIHELNEDDPDHSLQFCEELMLRRDEDPNF